MWAARTECPDCVCKPTFNCHGTGATTVSHEPSWTEAALSLTVLVSVFSAGLAIGAGGQRLVLPAVHAARAALTPAAGRTLDELAREQAAAARARTLAPSPQ